MSLSKDRETHQQSYFYVVWPEDKSAVQSSAATDSTASSIQSFNYDSQAITASSKSGSHSTSNLQQGSPVPVVSPLSKEPAVCMASEQVMTSTNASQDTSNCSRDKTQPEQHRATTSLATSSTSMTVSSSFVLPSLDSFSAASSMGRQRTADLAPFGRPRVYHGKPGSPGAGEANLREIGDAVLTSHIHSNYTL